MLAALLQVQSIERQLAHVRRRLRIRQNAVTTQQRRIDQLKADWQILHDKCQSRRMDADNLELDLRQREEDVAKHRNALNTARTNKEYATILTHINTLKADNSKLEEHILRIMQEVDVLKVDTGKLAEQVKGEESRLDEVRRVSADEIGKLDVMVENLAAQRGQAAQAVPSEALGVFDRIAEKHDGDAMAVIQVHGKRPPHDYVCGGCYMALNAEHVNALRVRDEIRTCDNCGRILYLEPQAEASRTR
ncbi:MAG TPA: C4-type zinc ribbon domain-containing protein [Phycisphaerae bacterium]|nr:C4-type zinc ribbon domain-containing protein [Phycisphaerae bacterium]